MARTESSQGAERTKGTDPTWPEHGPGDHPVTELVADRQGSLSPFGDTTFPLDENPYVHPVTVISR